MKNSGKNKAKQIAPKAKAEQHTTGGLPMSAGYKGSDLAKNHKSGKAQSSLYMGSNLKKNYANGYSYTTGYKGNKLNVGDMTSRVEGV